MRYARADRWLCYLGMVMLTFGFVWQRWFVPGPVQVAPEACSDTAVVCLTGHLRCDSDCFWVVGSPDSGNLRDKPLTGFTGYPSRGDR